MSSRFFCLLLAVMTVTTMVSPLFAAEEAMEKQAEKQEKTVYVPYDKLQKVFEQPGRGVFLPYEEFQKLWNAARSVQGTKPTDLAPVAAMITEMSASATAADEIVRVEATLSIELLRDGWHEIPLRLGDAAITKATIGGEPARILGGPGNSAESGYKILLEKKKIDSAEKPGKPMKSERLELTLHFAKAIDKSPGRNSVAFQVPQSPLTRWKVTVPDADAKIEFLPLVAASGEKPDEKTRSDKTVPKESVLEAFVGPTPEVRIAWTPKAEGATGLEALTSVQLLQKSTVDEGILRTSARFEYSIGRSTISEISLQVPTDQKVVSVFDPNIKKWSLAPSDGNDKGQTVRIELFEPAGSLQAVQLELEQMLGNETLAGTPAKSVKIPELSAIGAGRMQGILVVGSAGELSTETLRSSGLFRMDASELPDALRQGPTKWDAAYRISSASYSLELAVNKVEPRITATAQSAVTLSAETLKTETNFALNIDRAGIFQISVEIPKDVQNLSAFGFVANEQAAANVDSFSLADSKQDGMTTMTVNLRRKALGRVGLKISYTKPLDEADLRSSTGNVVEIPIRLPKLTPGTSERFEGRAVLFAPVAFRVNAVDTESLQAISLRQMSEAGWSLPLHEAQLAFLQADAPASFKLRAERRKSQMTLREARTVRIDDGVIRQEAKFYYDILFSGVKSLRIDVPKEISERLNVQDDWRETVLVPQPEDVLEDYVAWEFARKSELIGSGVLAINWEQELTQLDVGKSLPLDVPRLVPKKQQPADRLWGRLVLAKSLSIDLGESEDSRGLKPIDPMVDVPGPDRVGDAVAAFEYHDDWRLRVVATRYKLEDVKRTSIERGLVQANLYFSKKGAGVIGQALFRIRSVQQRLELAMPPGAGILSVKINGQNVVLESEETVSARYMIPLTAVQPDTPFTLDIRYTLPEPCQNRIAIPTFPGDGQAAGPAMQKVHLAVYVPDDYVPVAYRGHWSKDFSFGNYILETGAFSHSGIEMLRREFSLSDGDEFQASGKPFLFSAVNPMEGETLTLMVWRDSISVIGFFLVLLPGLALMRVSWLRRFQAVIVALAVCVAVGFVWTTLAELLPNQPGIIWAVNIVALCWGLQAFVQGSGALRRHCPLRKLTEPEATEPEEGRAPQDA